MKDVYNYNFQFRFKGEENFLNTTFSSEIFYLEPEDAKEWDNTIESFDELVSFVKDGLFPNAEITKTFFTKKLVVGLRSVDKHCLYYWHKITKKNFRPVEIRKIYNKTNYTIKELSNILKAEDFFDYCNHRMKK